MSAILDALPAVQTGVREEIAARIKAGERVAGKDHAREIGAELRKLQRAEAGPGTGGKPSMRRTGNGSQLRGRLRRDCDHTTTS